MAIKEANEVFYCKGDKAWRSWDTCLLRQRDKIDNCRLACKQGNEEFEKAQKQRYDFPWVPGMIRRRK